MEEWEKHWQNLLNLATKEVGDFCQQVVDQVEIFAQEAIETVDLIAEEIFDLIDLELDYLNEFVNDLINDDSIDDEIKDHPDDNEDNYDDYYSNLTVDQLLNHDHENDDQNINQYTDQNGRNNVEDSLNNLDSFEFYHTPKIEPSANFHPACIGCKNYHGHVYGRNLLICGMHPYGWDDDDCPDFSS